jgi:hypothetical protein
MNENAVSAFIFGHAASSSILVLGKHAERASAKSAMMESAVAIQ